MNGEMIISLTLKISEFKNYDFECMIRIFFYDYDVSEFNHILNSIRRKCSHMLLNW